MEEGLGRVDADSVRTGTTAKTRPNVPASVVMIDEARIDTDLPSAIRRIREDPDTAGHRVLVIAREEVVQDPDTVPALEAPALILEPAPPAPSRALSRRPESVERRAAGESLRRIGAAILRASEAVDVFIEAGKRVAEELKTAPNEGDRPHLKRAIRGTPSSWTGSKSPTAISSTSRARPPRAWRRSAPPNCSAMPRA